MISELCTQRSDKECNEESDSTPNHVLFCVLSLKESLQRPVPYSRRLSVGLINKKRISDFLYSSSLSIFGVIFIPTVILFYPDLWNFSSQPTKKSSVTFDPKQTSIFHKEFRERHFHFCHDQTDSQKHCILFLVDCTKPLLQQYLVLTKVWLNTQDICNR